MASTIILIDLTNVNNWVVEDTINEDINPDYAQKTNPPTIGWTINTLPTAEGIKSSSLFFRDPNFTQDLNVESDNSYEIGAWIDTLGNTTYRTSNLFVNINIAVGYRMSIYWQDAQTPIADVPNSPTPLTMRKWSTVFQNRTMQCFDATTSFATSPDVVLAGDVAATQGVYDLTLTASEITLTKFELTGITVDSTFHRGFTSLGNYLLFWTSDTIFWSDPNDFTVFSIGGGSLAGSQKISEAKGVIATVVPFPDGLMIYCTGNIVSMVFSGDSSNPWIFTEIPQSSKVLFSGRIPLVAHNEESKTQYAFTSKGLVRVSTDGMQLLPERLNKFLNTSSVETKAVGTSQIIVKEYSPQLTREIKVQKLILLDDILFIMVGQENPDEVDFYDNRLYTIDLQTGKMGILDGEFLSVTNEIDSVLISSTNLIEDKGSIRSGSYVLVMETNHDPDPDINRRFLLLDYTTKGETVLEDSGSTPTIRDSEVFVGDISINPSRLTELLGVKLIGETSVTPASSGGDNATRARVFVYSSTDTTPVEFPYYPSVGRYLGFVTGDDIEVEVRGKHFYLTSMELEIQDGGRKQ